MLVNSLKRPEKQQEIIEIENGDVVARRAVDASVYSGQAHFLAIGPSP